EILRALQDLKRDWRFFIRTTAPDWIFDSVRAVHFSVPPIPFDSGAIEDDVFTINRSKTMQAVQEVFLQRSLILKREIDFLQKHKVNYVLADIPFLAGPVAQQAG